MLWGILLYLVLCTLIGALAGLGLWGLIGGVLFAVLGLIVAFLKLTWDDWQKTRRRKKAAAARQSLPRKRLP